MRTLAAIFVVFGMIGCASGAPTPHASPPARTVVIWISLDGMRHDYVERYQLSFLNRAMREGVFTRRMVPVFPTLTFPSHSSEITGAPVDQHGITGNTFYDSSTGQTYKYVDDASLLLAEPIWVTATRQHVRTAVVEWPVSYAQTGKWRADYFEEKYTKDRTDALRLDQLLQLWQSDDPQQHGGAPLQLLIGYVPGPDMAGHKYGPEAPEMGEKLRETDLLLEGFTSRAVRIFKEKMRPQDQLYIMFTTDHGMSFLHTRLVLEDVLGSELIAGTHFVTSGNIAHIFLDDVPIAERPARQEAILMKLRALPQAETWTRATLPPIWHYAHPTRTGDIVISLRPGFSWKSKPKPQTQPTTLPTSAPTTSESPKGMHGYPVEEDPDMLGLSVIFSPGRNLGGKDLGVVDSLQFEPTVCKLLGIDPAPAAKEAPLNVGR